MSLSNERLSSFLHIVTAVPFVLGAFAVATHFAMAFI
jgi:hypothetical protein